MPWYQHAWVWAKAWAAWPATTRHLRAEGWHRTGWATWQSPDPTTGGTTWAHPTKGRP